MAWNDVDDDFAAAVAVVREDEKDGEKSPKVSDAFASEGSTPSSQLVHASPRHLVPRASGSAAVTSSALASARTTADESGSPLSASFEVITEDEVILSKWPGYAGLVEKAEGEFDSFGLHNLLHFSLPTTYAHLLFCETTHFRT